MTITQHIKSCVSMHHLNPKPGGPGGTILIQREQSLSENTCVSQHVRSEDEVMFCNPDFDNGTEFISSGTFTDIDFVTRSLQVSTVSLQSRRPHHNRLTVLIFIAVILVVVLIFSLTLGIVMSKYKKNDLKTATLTNTSVLSTGVNMETESPPAEAKAVLAHISGPPHLYNICSSTGVPWNSRVRRGEHSGSAAELL